jgi:hypothetical protein
MNDHSHETIERVAWSVAASWARASPRCVLDKAWT